MKVYSIQIPPCARATFYKKDGVYYHTQNANHPQQPYSRYLWNSITKTTDEVDDKKIDTVVVPLIMCHPKDVNDYINHELPFLREALTNFYPEKGNMFVCCSDLQADPVYVGLFGMEGVGENLWEKP